MITLGELVSYKAGNKPGLSKAIAEARKAKPSPDMNNQEAKTLTPKQRWRLSKLLANAVSRAEPRESPISDEFGLLEKIPSDTRIDLLRRSYDKNCVPKPSVQREIFQAAKKAERDRIEGLLIDGADPNLARDELGRTAFMGSAMINRFDLLDILRRAGADINLTDPHGRTALDLVYAASGLCEMAWTLAEMGVKEQKYRIDWRS